MPVTTSFPGVYIEELPSTSRTVAAAPTSIAVFVGYTHPYKTPASNVNRAVELFSFTDYEREFGGLYNGTALDANVPDAVNQFFMNGGAQAYVVGLKPIKYGDGTAPANLADVTAAALAPSGVTFTAKEPTSPVKMSLSIDNVVADTADVTISYGTRPPEVHRGVSVNATTPNPSSAATRMAGSTLVTVSVGSAATFTPTPAATPVILDTTVPQIVRDGITFALKPPTNATAVDIKISNI
jgi:phage tail sheath protein FI